MSNICFNHSGNLGDILYSLHFCIEYLEYLKIPVTMCDFNLQINQEGDRTNNHPYGKYLMTDDAANFLLPLLKIIGFKQITISEKCPENAFDLSLFRKLILNFAPSDLRNLYYQLIGNHLPQDYSRKIFNISGRFNELNNKILFSYTKRYQNPFINYKELERFKDLLLFIGLKDEYEYFIKNYFNLDYLPLNNCLDAAEKMLSAKGVIGNQSGLFAIAEMLKVPRILVTAEFLKVENKGISLGPVNVNPIGGWFENIRVNQKLIPSVNELLNIK